MRIVGAKLKNNALAALLVVLTLLACDTQPDKSADSPGRAFTEATVTYLPLPLPTGVSGPPPPAIPTDRSGHQLISPWPTGEDGPLDTPTPVPTLSPEQKIAPDLLQAMTANPNDISFAGVLYPMSGAVTNEEAKRLAERTHAQITAQLEELKQQGQVTSYDMEWASNVFFVKGTALAVKELAKQPGILHLNLNHVLPADAYPKPIPVGTIAIPITPTPLLRKRKGVIYHAPTD